MELNNTQLIDIIKIKDERGTLSVIEKEVLPFEMKRIYYLYDVPSDAYRGGHAHIEQQEFLVALSGSFNVTLKSTEGKTIVVKLNKPNKGLLIPKMIWRELDDFSSGSVCLVIASDVFNEDDYIRDYNSFIK